MADFSWVPEELEGRFSYVRRKLVASCEVCGATKSTQGKGSVLRDIDAGRGDRFRFCSIHGGFRHAKPSKEDMESWPSGHKRCRRCLRVLEFSSFHKSASSLFGYAVECKGCKKTIAKAYNASRTFEQTMFSASKFRAKKNGIPHTITIDDIVVPERCPVLGVKIELERGSMYAPSIDQIRPSLGYTPDNIIIMSRRANTLKSDITPNEAHLLSDWMRNNIG